MKYDKSLYLFVQTKFRYFTCLQMNSAQLLSNRTIFPAFEIQLDPLATNGPSQVGLNPILVQQNYLLGLIYVLVSNPRA